MVSRNVRPGLTGGKAPREDGDDEGRREGRHARSDAGFTELTEGIELFRTHGGMPYAGVELDGRVSYVPIRDGAFANLLRIRYLDATGQAPSEAALKRQIGTLAALAQHRGQEADLHVRFGANGSGEIFVDRATEDGAAYVRITPDGWETVSESPIHFWRSENMMALPHPVQGSLDSIRPFLNLHTEDDHKLMQGYAVSAFLPRPPHFVLILQGPQGSGKSAAARVLSRLIHPAGIETRHRPGNADDLLVAARRAPLLIHDNLSEVRDWESDVYCGLATGTGWSKRLLYTSLDEVAFSVSSRVILTGIGDLARRDDLRERAIILSLPKLGPDQLKDEHHFWNEFEVVRPEILGALYTAVSGALRRRDITTTWLPRMATPARWVTAAEQALGWDNETFLGAYRRNRDESVETIIEYDAVAPYVRAVAVRYGTWVGTSTALLRTLREHRNSEDRNPAFPRSPAELGRLLSRIAPALEEVGVEVRKRRESGGQRTRLIEISSDGFRTLDRAEKRRRQRQGRKQSSRSEEIEAPERLGLRGSLRRILGFSSGEAA